MYPMHMKFAVFGATGAGKTTLIELLQKINPGVSVHIKDTTRTQRPSEISGTHKTDLRFLTEAEFSENRKKGEYDIVYVQRDDSLYGVRQDQLLRAAQEKTIHFVILNDIAGIHRLKFMYQDARAIYLHADPRDIPKHLQEREGIPFEERVKRAEKDYNEFIAYSNLFDHVIINFWEKKNAITQLQNMLLSYLRRASIL